MATARDRERERDLEGEIERVRVFKYIYEKWHATVYIDACAEAYFQCIMQNNPYSVSEYDKV